LQPFPFAVAGLHLLGKVDEKFVEVVDVFEPLADGTADKAFISKVSWWMSGWQ
jgi:predicted ATP-dependent Lon-type protease